MNKNVTVKIETVNDYGDTKDRTNISKPGLFYIKNDKRYCLYEDDVSNTIKYYDNTVEITRKGEGIFSKLVYKVGEHITTKYTTPYGIMELETYTRVLEIEEQESYVGIYIEYDICMQGAPVSNNTVTIDVR